MKITLDMILINKEEDRDTTGLGIRPRLNSIVQRLTPEGAQGSSLEEWRPEPDESQFDCLVREFRAQYEPVMPDFFKAPISKGCAALSNEAIIRAQKKRSK